MSNLDYGVIGNCRTAALISPQGAIDWLCFPDFDSPSIFARILDAEKGGFFDIQCSGTYETSQHYVTKTNILRTHFISKEGEFIIYDYMPRYKLDDGRYHHPAELVRYIVLVRGTPKIRIQYNPAILYGKYQTISKAKNHSYMSWQASGGYTYPLFLRPIMRLMGPLVGLNH